jgi:hypothetical protein
MQRPCSRQFRDAPEAAELLAIVVFLNGRKSDRNVIAATPTRQIA